MKCQCVSLLHVLRKAGFEVGNGGVRCGLCVDAVLEEKNRLVRDNLWLMAKIGKLLEERQARDGEA